MNLVRIIAARDRLVDEMTEAGKDTDRPVERLAALLRNGNTKLRRIVEAESTSKDARDVLRTVTDVATPLIVEQDKTAGLGFPGCGGYTPEGVVVVGP